MASKNVVELSDQNFETEIIKFQGVALVDFWAEWCMPCKMLAPTIDELADEYAGKLKVAKMDTDKSRQVPVKFSITLIPTLLIFKNGQLVKMFRGPQQKRQLKAILDELLATQ